MSVSHTPQATRDTNVLSEYNVSMALLNCHPADRAVLVDAIKRLEDTGKRRRKILNLVLDALAQLRLDVKYLVFDLQATRKERDEAIAKLEKK